jgi:hypothetical protein
MTQTPAREAGVFDPVTWLRPTTGNRGAGRPFRSLTRRAARRTSKKSAAADAVRCERSPRPDPSSDGGAAWRIYVLALRILATRPSTRRRRGGLGKARRHDAQGLRGRKLVPLRQLSPAQTASYS